MTLPSEADFIPPAVGKWAKKYFSAKDDVPTESRMRILRLIENITLCIAAVGCITESMQRTSFSLAQRIMILRELNMEKKKRARALCGADGDG